MAIRGKSKVGWLVAGLSLLLVAIFNENIANLAEETGLNKLWMRGGWLLDVLFGIGHFLISPWLTHIYAAIVGGVVVLIVAAISSDQGHSVPDRSRKPDMSLAQLVNYLTTASQWAEDQNRITDRMVEEELLDYLASGKLIALARPRSNYGTPAPLELIGRGYFSSVQINMPAVREGVLTAITTKPGYFGGDEFDDFRFWRSDVEQIWPPKRVEKPSRWKSLMNFGKR